MVLASTGPGCLGVLSVTLTSVATHLPFIHNPYRATAQKLSSKLVPVTRTATSVRDFRIRSLTDAIDELQRPKPNLELTGTWRKDKAASDAMDEACDMVALPWIFRQALIVLNTLKLEDTPEHFKTVLKAGGVMDVKERYAMAHTERALFEIKIPFYSTITFIR